MVSPAVSQEQRDYIRSRQEDMDDNAKASVSIAHRLAKTEIVYTSRAIRTVARFMT